MTPTFFSHFSAISEIFVTAGVFYVVWSSYKGRGFPWKLGAAIAVFEFSVNMLYMTMRMQHHSQGVERNWLTLLAALHGVLSLVVFVMFALLVFLAYFAHKRGEQYFQQRPGLTWTFLSMWVLSVGSGWIFYFTRFS
ncbi:MAG: hypothetical protein U1F11_03800 [Steroidobacteraceae bacterium]